MTISFYGPFVVAGVCFLPHGSLNSRSVGLAGSCGTWSQSRLQKMENSITLVTDKTDKIVKFF